MAKQYTWTNADGLTLGGGRNSPDTSTPEYTAELSQADVTAVQALVSGAGNRPLSRMRRLRVVPLGDSITQGGSSSASEIWRFGNTIPEHLIFQSGAPMRIIRNAGISGQTTAQIRARLTSDCLAYSPDVVPLLAGTNNLSSGMSNAAIASMMNDIEWMVAEVLKAGALPVLFTPPPKDAAQSESRRVQPYYYALAEYYGIPLFDIYRVLVNPSTGSYASGNSLDGTHPSPLGVSVCVAAYAAQWANLASFAGLPYLAAVSETSAGQLANLIRNGAFAISASPPTPDGWSVNSTNATPTLVSATLPNTGNNFNYVKSLAGAVFALSGNDINSGFSVGNVLRFSGRVTISGLTPASASGIQVSLGLNGASGAADSLRVLNSCPFNGSMTFDHEFTVPTGCTSITPSVYVQDVMTMVVNNLTLVNDTARRAIWTPGAPT